MPNRIGSQKTALHGINAISDNDSGCIQSDEAFRNGSAYTRSLIEASLDPLVTIGPDGRITDVNAATEKVTGYTREKLIGTDFSDYFTDPDKAREGYRRAFQEGLVRDYPLAIQRRDGEVTSVLYNASVYRDDDGQVIGVFAAARDITERKQLDKEMEKYVTFFKLSSDAMCIADPFGNFKHVNPAMMRLTGYEEGELISKPFISFILPEDREKTAEEMKRQVAVGLSLNFENRYQCKDGRVILLSWVAHFDKNDGVTYASARDITQLRRAEEELRKLNEELEKRVLERTEELEAKNIELERWNKIFIGRELRMIELKQRIRELEGKTAEK